MNIFIEVAEWIANLLSSVGVAVALYTLFGMITNKLSRSKKIKYLKVWFILLAISIIISSITFILSIIFGIFKAANIIIIVLKLLAIYVVIEVLHDVKWEK